jgi:hypothetical protein
MHEAELKVTPEDYYLVEGKISVLADEAIVDHKLGDLTRARTACREGLALADAVIRKDPALRDSITGMNKLRREAHALGVQ